MAATQNDDKNYNADAAEATYHCTLARLTYQKFVHNGEPMKFCHVCSGGLAVSHNVPGRGWGGRNNLWIVYAQFSNKFCIYNTRRPITSRAVFEDFASKIIVMARSSELRALVTTHIDSMYKANSGAPLRECSSKQCVVPARLWAMVSTFSKMNSASPQSWQSFYAFIRPKYFVLSVSLSVTKERSSVTLKQSYCRRRPILWDLYPSSQSYHSNWGLSSSWLKKAYAYIEEKTASFSTVLFCATRTLPCI